jgi:hypothetical protein
MKPISSPVASENTPPPLLPSAASMVFIAFALAFVIGPGPGEPPSPIDLTWSAPGECPGAPAVHAEIDRLLERSEAERSDVSVTARVSTTAGSYQVELQLRQAGTVGVRTLPVATCAEAVDATALWVAIAPEATPRPTNDLPDSPLPQPPPAVEKPDAALLRPGLHGFAAGGAAVGIVPGWGGFVQLGAIAKWRRFQLEVVASGWLPRRAEGTGDVTGRFHLWTGGVAACPVLRPHPRVSVPLCAAVHVGAMLGRGITGLQDTRRSVAPWLGAALAPAVTVRVHRWVSLRAGPQMVISIIRPAFDTDQGTLVHRADRLGGTFTAGIVIGAQPL